MIAIFVAFALLQCTPTFGHFALRYLPAGLPIRNAPGPDKNGRFSTSQEPCAGELEWGKNSHSVVTVGEEITFAFNYGTGTDGDHQSNKNRIRVLFLDVANLSSSEIAAKFMNPDSQSVLVDAIDASPGSRPEGYQATVQIPFECAQCVLVAIDQRRWSGCLDLVANAAAPAPPSTTTTTTTNDPALTALNEAECAQVCAQGFRKRSTVSCGECYAEAYYTDTIRGCSCPRASCAAKFKCNELESRGMTRCRSSLGCVSDNAPAPGEVSSGEAENKAPFIVESEPSSTTANAQISVAIVFAIAMISFS